MMPGRSLATFLLIFGLFTAETCKESQVSTVKIKFTRTETYCGGAAPPDFLIERLRTPKPYESGMLYIWNDNEVCVDSFLPQKDSALVMTATAGKYNVHLVPKSSAIVETEERKKCLAEWQQRSLTTFVVGGTDTTMTVNIHFDCNPCYPPPP